MMKLRTLAFVSLILLSSQGVLASPRRGLKMTYLSDGRIGLQACDSSGCKEFGNPNGYTKQDIQSMWDLNHYTAMSEAGFAAVSVALSGGLTAGIFGGGSALAGVVTFLAGAGVQAGVLAGIGTMTQGLSPRYQWTKGNLKQEMRSTLRTLKKPGDSAFLVSVSSDSGLRRDERITQDILKQLPSDRTSPRVARNDRSNASAAH